MKEKIKELIECCINDSEYVTLKHHSTCRDIYTMTRNLGITISDSEELYKTFNYIDSGEYLRSERKRMFNINFIFSNDPGISIYPIIKESREDIVDKLCDIPKRWYHLTPKKEIVKIKYTTNIYEYEIVSGNFKFRVDEYYVINLRDAIRKNYDKFINSKNEKVINDRIQEFKNK